MKVLRVLFFLLFITVFSSCELLNLLHMLPPGLNNQYTKAFKSSFLILENVPGPASFAFGVDEDDTVFTAIITNMFIYMYAFDLENYKQNYITSFDPGGPSSDIKMKTIDNYGLSLLHQYDASGSEGKMYNYQNSSWNHITTSGITSMQFSYVFDFAANTSSHIYAVSKNNLTNNQFQIYLADNPAINTSFYTLSTQANLDGEIMDISVGINSDWLVYIACATTSRVYLFGMNYPQAPYLSTDEGYMTAKVIVTKDNVANLFYLNRNHELVFVRAVYDNEKNEMHGLYKQVVYTDGIKENSSFSRYNLSVAYDYDTDTGYIGFVNNDYNVPVIYELKNGNVSPMINYFSDLTNCEYVQMAIDQDGNPLCAMLFKNSNVFVLSTWNTKE